MLSLFLLLACTPDPAPAPTAVTGPVPWSETRGDLVDDIGEIRAWTPRRAIIHLHSPWSHDACDGEPLPDGRPDPDCLQDLWDGLCADSIDAAFLTDHPSYAEDQAFGDLIYSGYGEVVEEDGLPRATRIACPNGHEVVLQAGVEGGLMPVGMHGHPGADPTENSAYYRDETPAGIAPLQAAGGVVLQAHTEGRDLAELQALQAAGLSGVEAFNLHAMFDPDIRADDLGLDSWGWLQQVSPFVADDGTAEPDLVLLAVLERQDPSLERWDALLADGPMVGTAGTDAHENVLSNEMRDGERFDSYRRMMGWFSNVLLSDDDAPDALADTVAAGRLYIAFELLGTPQGFDLSLESASGDSYEMGETAPEGTLHVGCPTLSPASPRGADAPEIAVTVYRDGVPWQSACGDFDADGPAVYRVEVDILPAHLREFLGEDPSPWLHFYPWILSNPLLVAPGA